MCVFFERSAHFATMGWKFLAKANPYSLTDLIAWSLTLGCHLSLVFWGHLKMCFMFSWKYLRSCGHTHTIPESAQHFKPQIGFYQSWLEVKNQVSIIKNKDRDKQIAYFQPLKIEVTMYFLGLVSIFFSLLCPLWVFSKWRWEGKNV